MFAFLDMKVLWQLNRKMMFGVYRKEKQMLKYLNTSSCHTHSTFKAIPAGISKRLSRLTLMEDEIARKIVDELYPDHVKSPWTSKLIPKVFLTFGELWEDDKKHENIEKK